MHAIIPEFTVFNTKNKFDWMYLFLNFFNGIDFWGFTSLPQLVLIMPVILLPFLYMIKMCSEYI